MVKEKIDKRDPRNVAHIRFPYPLSVSQAEEILEYLSEKLPAEIKYNVVIKKGLSHGISAPKGGHILEGKLARFIGDTIDLDNPPHDFTIINESHQEKYPGDLPLELTVFYFAMYGFHKIRDHNPRDVKMWEDTASILKEYFSKHKRIRA